MVDLETATMEELAAEIQRRTDGYLLVVHYAKTKTSADVNETLVSFHGGVPLALGLASWARLTLAKRHIDGK